MSGISTPDQHRIRAAEGWLELGNVLEAEAELEQIAAGDRGHPDVVHVRWQIARAAGDWERCLELGMALTELAPAEPRSWTALAQGYYYSKRIQEAYDLAVSKITRFPTHWPLYYDAACYACLTGRFDQARQFLALAGVFGDDDQVKRLAANDPDLKALHSAS